MSAEGPELKLGNAVSKRLHAVWFLPIDMNFKRSAILFQAKLYEGGCHTVAQRVCRQTAGAARDLSTEAVLVCQAGTRPALSSIAFHATWHDPGVASCGTTAAASSATAAAALGLFLRTAASASCIYERPCLPSCFILTILLPPHLHLVHLDLASSHLYHLVIFIFSAHLIWLHLICKIK